MKHMRTWIWLRCTRCAVETSTNEIRAQLTILHSELVVHFTHILYIQSYILYATCMYVCTLYVHMPVLYFKCCMYACAVESR